MHVCRNESLMCHECAQGNQGQRVYTATQYAIQAMAPPTASTIQFSALPVLMMLRFHVGILGSVFHCIAGISNALNRSGLPWLAKVLCTLRGVPHEGQPVGSSPQSPQWVHFSWVAMLQSYETAMAQKKKSPPEN